MERKSSFTSVRDRTLGRVLRVWSGLMYWVGSDDIIFSLTRNLKNERSDHSLRLSELLDMCLPVGEILVAFWWLRKARMWRSSMSMMRMVGSSFVKKW